MPAPEFFDGVSVALRHNEGGHDAYLLGQVSKRGWWYYFPVTLAVKTPIGFLLLLTVGVYTLEASRETGIPSAGLLSRNPGFRHGWPRGYRCASHSAGRHRFVRSLPHGEQPD